MASIPSTATSSRRPALALVLLALVLACCGRGGEAELVGAVAAPAPDLADVSLPDAAHAGAEFPIEADQGELLLVYFGYTSCPDVCPTTLVDVGRAIDSLDPGRADRVDLAMITIDPERDTDEVLVGYVRSFVPDARALVTTDDVRLRAVADAFGVTYAVEANSDGGTDVSHTSTVFAIDADARVVAMWPFGSPVDDIASDLDILLDRT